MGFRGTKIGGQFRRVRMANIFIKAIAARKKFDVEHGFTERHGL